MWIMAWSQARCPAIMKIRPINRLDASEWSRLRTALWPDTSDHHRAEIDEFFTGNSVDVVEVFVADRANTKLAGFIELNIRSFVEGSRATQVPYVEAWYVDADLRGQGIGKRLMQRAESWARDKGFTELGSDAELHNPNGIAAHKALGFNEVYKIVCFLKQLD